jgi:hypothetical protein
MGFVVLHIDKASGNDAGMTAHIERTINPTNADKERTHLNRKLIEFPEGVDNRTQAIQHRLDNAGLTRKIGTNQVRALRIMLSGTPEDMQRIEATGKLGEWCEDNLAWLRKTYGADNVVSAVLHMDEKTPHIHATVVPIVTGERRKAQAKPAEPEKKRYRKKNANTPRLCADDVMSRPKLKEYQDTYAEAMSKYGLKRGIDGSEAKHTTNQEYYRELFVQKDELQEYVEVLQEEKTEINEKIRNLYDRKDEAREKFLNMHEYNKQKESEISVTESRLAQLKQEYEPYKAQEDMNLFFGVFPKLNEHLRTVQLCKGIGLTVDAIKKLFNGEIVPVTGKLHSPEHDRDFSVQDAKLQLFREQDNPDKFRLSLNGQNIFDWFKQKYQEIKQTIRPHIKPPAKP